MLFLKLAFRYLVGGTKSTKFITFISFLGVFLATSSMLLTLGVMNGFEKCIKDGILSSTPHITIFVSNRNEAQKLVNRLKKESFTKKVYWFATFGAILQKGNQLTGTVLIGIPYKERKILLNRKRVILKGNLNIDSLVLGNLLASRLGIFEVPNKVTVISPIAKRTPIGFIPIIRKVKISGVYSTGIYTLDMEGISYFDFLRKFLKPNTFQVVLELKNPYKAEEIKRRIQKKFPLFFISTWIDSNKDFFKAIQLEKLGMTLVVGLITLVASFNILSLLITKIRELSKDFAIFRAFGLERYFIFKLVLTLGFLIGFFGSLTGTLTATILAYIANRYELIKVPADIYMSPYLPILFGFKEIFFVNLFVLGLAIFAAFIPAKIAVAEKITEVLRNN